MKSKVSTSARKLDNLPTGSVVEYTGGEVYRKIEDGWARYHDLTSYQHPLSSTELVQSANKAPFLVLSEPTPTTYMLENSNVVLKNVHKESDCVGDTCVIHKKTKHHMRHMPQLWRSDRGIMERVCEHGVGHPDPDSPWPRGSYEWIHGCDGCCYSAVVPLSQ